MRRLVHPGGPPRVLQQHQRQQSEDGRLVRHQLAQQSRQSDRLVDQVAPDCMLPARGAALVEDQVDRGRHGGQRSGRSASDGTPYGM